MTCYFLFQSQKIHRNHLTAVLCFTPTQNNEFVGYIHNVFPVHVMKNFFESQQQGGVQANN